MKQFLDNLLEWDIFLNGNILQPIIMILILFTGILLTVRTRFLQVRGFNYSFQMTLGKTIASARKKTNKTAKNKISPFAAFSAAVAGTVGTGNIAGVATAIISGGPGAIFWMWFSAFFGMVTNYSENILGIYFRKKDEKGEWKGGAMYYITYGLGKGFKWMAIIFAVCAVFASIGFNFVQSNSITQTITTSFNTWFGANETVVMWITAGIIAVISALVIIGGIKRISTMTSYLVPFMAIFYMILALVIIFMNVTEVPHAFAEIFQNAFSLKSVGGGIMGYAIMKAMRYGIARGIFSNEAGLGSSVMAHSSADVIEPVHQGLWGIFEVFLDTFIICTLTALVVLTSGAYEYALDAGITSTAVGQWAFRENLGLFGDICFTIILPLFAFTTLISWSYYGEKAFEYLFGFKSKLYYKIVYICLIIVGSVVSANLVWELADTFNVLMAIPNLIGLVLLSGLIAKITKNHFDRKKGLQVEPMLSFYPAENERLTQELIEEGNNASIEDIPDIVHELDTDDENVIINENSTLSDNELPEEEKQVTASPLKKENKDNEDTTDTISESSNEDEE